jgi:hypothetical protein
MTQVYIEDYHDPDFDQALPREPARPLSRFHPEFQALILGLIADGEIKGEVRSDQLYILEREVEPYFPPYDDELLPHDWSC